MPEGVERLPPGKLVHFEVICSYVHLLPTFYQNGEICHGFRERVQT